MFPAAPVYWCEGRACADTVCPRGAMTICLDRRTSFKWTREHSVNQITYLVICEPMSSLYIVSDVPQIVRSGGNFQ